MIFVHQNASWVSDLKVSAPKKENQTVRCVVLTSLPEQTRKIEKEKVRLICVLMTLDKMFIFIIVNH